LVTQSRGDFGSFQEASGAVGSVVGTNRENFGAIVVGIAGTDEKVEMLTSKFGFDYA